MTVGTACLSVVVASALAPANGEATFTSGELSVSRLISPSTVGCTSQSTSPALPADQPVPRGGSPVRTRAQSSASISASADDTVLVDTEISATARMQTAGGQPRRATMTFAGTSSSWANRATTTCSGYVETTVRDEFRVLVTRPTWATLTMRSKGAAQTHAYLTSGGYAFFDVRGGDLAASGALTYLLPPGSYFGAMEAAVGLESRTTVSERAASGTLTISLASAGSASAKPNGKAKPYVTLPAARTCATHDAKAKTTSSGKRAKKIKSITYKVNGKKAATLKGKKVTKAKTTSLKIADSKAAKVEAVVALKNGKKLTTKATYLACGA